MSYTLIVITSYDELMYRTPSTNVTSAEQPDPPTATAGPSIAGTGASGPPVTQTKGAAMTQSQRDKSRVFVAEHLLRLFGEYFGFFCLYMVITLTLQRRLESP